LFDSLATFTLFLFCKLIIHKLLTYLYQQIIRSKIRCNGCFPPVYYETYPHHPLALSGIFIVIISKSLITAKTFNTVAGRARSYMDGTDFNAVKDEYLSLLTAPVNVQENLDVVQEASDLNCHGFDNNCRWSNTNEDELDWKVLLSTPEAEPWISMLQTTHHPGQTIIHTVYNLDPGNNIHLSFLDASAAVLLSGNHRTWGSGQLVSDLLPCIILPLQLTATVWRSSSDGSFQQQPNLQICSRNTNIDQTHSNCILFPIQNGMPVTVNIPEPRDPTTPAQIILVGDNFVGKYGGAIFVQDITVGGNLVPDCIITTPLTTKNFNKPQQQQAKRLIPLHNFQDSSNSLVEVQELGSTQKISNLQQSSILQFASPLLADSLMVECLKLSCNPAEKYCGWQKGISGWMASTGTDGFSNPLSGIMVPPVGTNSFLVASYNSNSENSIRQIISPMLSISTWAQPVHFCFYEYFAVEGARFTMCTDEFNKKCFYSKTGIPKDGHLQESRRWNFQCTELPTGTYKIYVSAENNGPNQGDIGFVPLRLSRDLDGNDPIC
uniref:MAM domain-containing protein n=1 Tax=Brugia pahangi TaxID=6280 RepID=A0A158PQZ8_BRUPA